MFCSLFCCSCSVKKAWQKMPLSSATDMEELGKQIKKAPKEWKAILKYLQGIDMATISLGRHDIPGTGAYVNVQEYETKAEGQYEAHRKFIDVQIAVSGHEIIWVAPLSDVMGRTQDYSEEKDIEFYAGATNPKAVMCDAQNYVVLFPNDAHQPCITARGEQQCRIRKIVVKIPVR